MLVLSRKVGEQIRIAGDIVVVVKAIRGNRVQLGIEAPALVRVLRGELPNHALAGPPTSNPLCETQPVTSQNRVGALLKAR